MLSKKAQRNTDSFSSVLPDDDSLSRHHDFRIFFTFSNAWDAFDEIVARQPLTATTSFSSSSSRREEEDPLLGGQGAAVRSRIFPFVVVLLLLLLRPEEEEAEDDKCGVCEEEDMVEREAVVLMEEDAELPAPTFGLIKEDEDEQGGRSVINLKKFFSHRQSKAEIHSKMVLEKNLFLSRGGCQIPPLPFMNPFGRPPGPPIFRAGGSEQVGGSNRPPFSRSIFNSLAATAPTRRSSLSSHFRAPSTLPTPFPPPRSLPAALLPRDHPPPAPRGRPPSFAASSHPSSRVISPAPFSSPASPTSFGAPAAAFHAARRVPQAISSSSSSSSSKRPREEDEREEKEPLRGRKRESASNPAVNDFLLTIEASVCELQKSVNAGVQGLGAQLSKLQAANVQNLQQLIAVVNATKEGSEGEARSFSSSYLSKLQSLQEEVSDLKTKTQFQNVGAVREAVQSVERDFESRLKAAEAQTKRASSEIIGKVDAIVDALAKNEAEKQKRKREEEEAAIPSSFAVIDTNPPVLSPPVLSPPAAPITEKASSLLPLPVLSPPTAPTTEKASSLLLPPSSPIKAARPAISSSSDSEVFVAASSSSLFSSSFSPILRERGARASVKTTATTEPKKQDKAASSERKKGSELQCCSLQRGFVEGLYCGEENASDGQRCSYWAANTEDGLKALENHRREIHGARGLCKFGCGFESTSARDIRKHEASCVRKQIATSPSALLLPQSPPPLSRPTTKVLREITVVAKLPPIAVIEPATALRAMNEKKKTDAAFPNPSSSFSFEKRSSTLESASSSSTRMGGGASSWGNGKAQASNNSRQDTKDGGYVPYDDLD